MRTNCARALTCAILLWPMAAAANVACITDEDTGACCCTADADVCTAMGGTASTEDNAMKICCKTDEDLPPAVLTGGSASGVSVAVPLPVGGFAVCGCTCEGADASCDVVAVASRPGFGTWLSDALARVVARLRGGVSLQSATSADGFTASCLCRR